MESLIFFIWEALRLRHCAESCVLTRSPEDAGAERIGMAEEKTNTPGEGCAAVLAGTPRVGPARRRCDTKAEPNNGAQLIGTCVRAWNDSIMHLH